MELASLEPGMLVYDLDRRSLGTTRDSSLEGEIANNFVQIKTPQGVTYQSFREKSNIWPIISISEEETRMEVSEVVKNHIFEILTVLVRFFLKASEETQQILLEFLR